MVKHIHIPVDEGTYDRLARAKDEHGGTWEELVLDTVQTVYGIGEGKTEQSGNRECENGN